jgi:hypothetical protein
MEKKQKKAPKKKDKTVTFPASIRVNAYGFIGIRKPLPEALGWKLNENLQIERNADGSITVRKA